MDCYNKKKLHDQWLQFVPFINLTSTKPQLSLLGLNKFALVRFGFVLSSLLALQILLEAWWDRGHKGMGEWVEVMEYTLRKM